MRCSSRHQEPPVLPHWLFIMYRCATALAILMVIAAAVSLIVLAFLGVTALWDWGVLRTAGWKGLFART
jgi:hypothetical protein